MTFHTGGHRRRNAPSYQHGQTLPGIFVNDHEYPAEIWAESVAELKRTVDIPIIVSQFAISLAGHLKVAQMFEEAGADAIEIGLGCPFNIPGKKEMLGMHAAFYNPEIVGDVVRALKKQVSIPIGIKTVFNPLDPAPMLEVIKKCGVDYLCVAYNPSAVTNIDLDTGKPLLPSPTCGITGPMKRFVTYRLVASFP